MSFFDQVFRLFGKVEEAPQDPAETKLVLRVIVLVEVAAFDNHYSQEEHDFIIALLAGKHGLTQEEAERYCEMARQRRERHPDLFHFTRQINDALAIEEKVDLMTEVWQLILINRKIEHEEAVLAGRLKNLLRLDHVQWVEAKQRAGGLGNHLVGDGA